MRDTASMVGEDLGDACLSNANEERIFVSIRVRPLNEKERARHDVSEWDCIAGNTIRFKNSLAERSTSVDAYTFGNENARPLILLPSAFPLHIDTILLS